jgi:hypothetical protein
LPGNHFYCTFIIENLQFLLVYDDVNSDRDLFALAESRLLHGSHLDVIFVLQVHTLGNLTWVWSIAEGAMLPVLGVHQFASEVERMVDA